MKYTVFQFWNIKYCLVGPGRSKTRDGKKSNKLLVKMDSFVFNVILFSQAFFCFSTNLWSDIIHSALFPPLLHFLLVFLSFSFFLFVYIICKNVETFNLHGASKGAAYSKPQEREKGAKFSI